MKTIDQWLTRQAEFHPEKTAIIFDDRAGSDCSAPAHRISYADLDRRVNQVACLLKQHWKLHTGDRIAWLGLNHPDMFVLLFAAARLGIVVVPLNWRLSVDELVHVIEDSEPRLMFHDLVHRDIAQQLNSATGDNLICIALDDDQPPDNVSDNQNNSPNHQSLSFLLTEIGDDNDIISPDIPVNPETPFLLVYTSGTTGRPKGAVLPHRVMACNAQMSQHMYDLVADDRVLNVLPLFHVGGINIQPLPALMYGATLVLHRRFDPHQAVHALLEHDITLINTVPTLLQAMLDTDLWKSSTFDHLKSVSIGSTDVPLQLIDAVHDKNIPLVQVYGATETGPIAIYQRAESAFDTAGSIGRAGLLCDIKLVDPLGNEAPVNEPGEICVRGDNILSHYWQNPDATKLSLQNHWFHTGDVARLDEQGNYWFSDRLKHVIISGGENIYPAEIERVIREIDGVSAVSVVGKPDMRWGEIPVALIVADHSTLDESAIIEHCRSRLAKFKTPREVKFVTELPRNAMGKVVISEVRDIMSSYSDDQKQ